MAERSARTGSGRKVSPTPLTRQVTEALERIIAGEPSADKLAHALRHLAKWRSVLLANTIAVRTGTRVPSGPFAGLDYGGGASEGSRAARLLGAYEASLAPVFEEIVAGAYAQVIDVGSAEGYVAVGLARRMPDAIVLARDTDERARLLCTELAARNGVADRVRVGGAFTHAEFAMCADADTVVICDIEGAEDDLLDPVLAPGLLSADILVEAHDCFRPGISDRIAARFAATHDIRRLGRRIADGALSPWMEELSDLDRLLSLWEWRVGPTPWLWMVRR